MRKFAIGNAGTGSSWSMQFKTSQNRNRRPGKIGRANTRIVSRFPTLKGPPRMEGLRHYFHKHMAMLSPPGPHPAAWTAQTAPVVFELYGEPVEFTPDFTVVANRRTRAIRLLRAGTTLSEKRVERHSAVAAAYREVEQRLDIVTQEELESDVCLAAARTLFMHRQVDLPDDLSWQLGEEWDKRCPVALGALHASLGGGAESWTHLLCLAALEHLHLDFDGTLDGDTRVLACNVRGYRL